MKLVDIHAHLADERILADADEIIADAVDQQVRIIIGNAARLEEWDAICDLTRHRTVYGALGLHPFFVNAWQEDSLENLRDRVRRHEKVVAIGEIGLDFWEGRDDLDLQLRVLRSQLGLARDLDYPVILHNRKSWNEFLELLNEEGIESLRGVCHCFNGSKELARQLLDRGLMLSFCGPVTYRNARKIQDVAAYVPADRLLTETDCPDLPPRQVKPEKSLPQHVRYILETLADVRKADPDELAAQVMENARSLFGIES